MQTRNFITIVSVTAIYAILVTFGFAEESSRRHNWKGLSTFSVYGHVQPVLSIDCSNAGDRFLTGSHDGSAKIWDAKTGSIIQTLNPNSGPTRVAMYSGDGARILTCHFPFKRTDAPLKKPESFVYVWDARSGKPIMEKTYDTGYVHCGVISHDGKQMFLGDSDRVARLWDIEQKKVVRSFDGFTAPITCVALSRDSDLLAVGCLDGSLRVIHLLQSNNKNVESIVGSVTMSYPSPCKSVCFSPDGKQMLVIREKEVFLITLGGEEQLKIENIQNGNEGHIGSMESGIFSPDGRLFATMSHERSNQVAIYEIESGQLLQVYNAPVMSDRILCIAFSPDSRSLLSGHINGEVRRWDATLQTDRLKRLEELDGPATVLFSPNNKNLITAGEKTAILYDAATKEEKHRFEIEKGIIYSAAFSPDGKRLALGCGRRSPNDAYEYPTPGDEDDVAIHLFDFATKKKIGDPFLHQNSVLGVRFSPCGRFIISFDRHERIYCWDTKRGKQIISPLGVMVQSLTISPDGKMLLVGLRNGNAALSEYTLNGGNPNNAEDENSTILSQAIELFVQPKTTYLTKHRFPISAVSFSSDGKIVVSGDKDGMLGIWKTPELTTTGPASVEECQLEKLHDSVIKSILFRDADGLLITGGDDGWIRLNPTEDRSREKAQLVHEQVNSLDATTNGKEIIIGCQNGVVYSWNTQTISATRDYSASLRKNPDGSPMIPLSIAVSPKEDIAAVADWSDSIKIVDTKTGAIKNMLVDTNVPAESRGKYTHVCFSPDGQFLLTVCSTFDAPVMFKDREVADQHEQKFVEQYAQMDNMIKVWDVKKGTVLHSLRYHKNRPTSAAFTRDGKQILTGALDGSVAVWDAASAEKIQTFERVEDFIQGIEVAADGKTFFVRTGNKINQRDIISGKLVRTFVQGKGPTEWVAFAVSPDGQFLLGGSANKPIVCWEVASGRVVREFGYPLAEKESSLVVFSKGLLKISPDGQSVLAGHSDGWGKVYDLATGAEQAKFNRSSPIFSGDFSRDGRKIVLGSMNQEIVLGE